MYIYIYIYIRVYTGRSACSPTDLRKQGHLLTARSAAQLKEDTASFQTKNL